MCAIPRTPVFQAAIVLIKTTELEDFSKVLSAELWEVKATEMLLLCGRGKVHNAGSDGLWEELIQNGTTAIESISKSR